MFVTSRVLRYSRSRSGIYTSNEYYFLSYQGGVSDKLQEVLAKTATTVENISQLARQAAPAMAANRSAEDNFDLSNDAFNPEDLVIKSAMSESSFVDHQNPIIQESIKSSPPLDTSKLDMSAVSSSGLGVASTKSTVGVSGLSPKAASETGNAKSMHHDATLDLSSAASIPVPPPSAETVNYSPPVEPIRTVEPPKVVPPRPVLPKKETVKAAFKAKPRPIHRPVIRKGSGLSSVLTQKVRSIIHTKWLL